MKSAFGRIKKIMFTQSALNKIKDKFSGDDFLNRTIMKHGFVVIVKKAFCYGSVLTFRSACGCHAIFDDI